MKVNTHKEKSMEKENSLGLMEAPTMGNFMITILKDMVFMSGLMAEFLMESGVIIRWKGMGLLLGLMEENM